jgi:4-hydroxybenzoate polyprenyltransferase
VRFLTTFFKALRPINLGMLLVLQGLIRYTFLPSFGTAITLSSLNFYGLVLSLMCVTSAGYLINDRFDILTDRINKKTKLSAAYLNSFQFTSVYVLLNLIGLLLGTYISIRAQNYFALVSFLTTPVLLFLYAKHLKQLPLAGNILVSVLVALSVWIYASFELEIWSMHHITNLTLWYFCGMSFLITLGRELIKDVQDIKGDYAASMHTLAICLGRSRTKNIVFAILLSLLGLSLVFFNTHFLNQPVNLAFAYALIIVPVSLLTWQCSQARSIASFNQLSRNFKIISLLGVIMIWAIKF